jgi:RHS repeat-associated protein
MRLPSLIQGIIDEWELITGFSEQRYLPFGEVRTDVGTAITQTDFGYTGQRNKAYINLMDYRARFYSPYLNRWTQPDTVVPNPEDNQEWNRYTYVGNNPINYHDPSGHVKCKIKKGVSGVSDTQCLQWVEDTLTVLDQTPTGNQLADRFRSWDSEHEVTIVVSDGSNSPRSSRMTAKFNNIYIHPDVFNDSPANLSTSAWSRVPLFAHETVHLGPLWGRGPGNRVETEAYYLQGVVTDELNQILTANGESKIDKIGYVTRIQDYLKNNPGANYYDQETIDDFNDYVNEKRRNSIYYPFYMKKNLFCYNCEPLVETEGLEIGVWK